MGVSSISIRNLMDDLMLHKKLFRKQVREMAEKHPSRLLSLLSGKIADSVLDSEEYKSAQTLAGYASTAGEVDTTAILQKALEDGKRLILPKVSQTHCSEMSFHEIKDMDRDLIQEPPFGISQPVKGCSEIALQEAELVLVPGMGFDHCCQRLGRGKGFYDRALSKIDSKTFGLAFQFQMFPEIPTDSRDVPLDRVITDKHIYEYRRSGFASAGPEDTNALGMLLGEILPDDLTVALIGPLGVGKTVLVQGILKGRGCRSIATSPTYTLVNIYPAESSPIHHLDLFRWERDRATEENIEELWEILSSPGLTLIEWADKASEMIQLESPVLTGVLEETGRREWILETFLHGHTFLHEKCLRFLKDRAS